MRKIGLIKDVLTRNKKATELEFLFDLDLLHDKSKRVHMKRLAVETCISFLGRTISQSEFRVKDKKNFLKDELYYRLNVRPGKNMTASTFWHTVIYKLVYDNECLIIQADDGDLLIADDFQHKEYAVLEDTFHDVVVKDYTFKRVFKQREVLHWRYSNERLNGLIEGLFADYGELFGRILTFQKRKNQIRGTVDVDLIGLKTEEAQAQLQGFIDKVYGAIQNKATAIFPQQKGLNYKEHFSGSSVGQTSVDEVNKVTDGFLDQVAMAMGIPPELIRGKMADVEEQTKNYLTFTVDPLLKKIKDEANEKFIGKEGFKKGKEIDIRKISMKSIFDLSNAIDKVISSGVLSPNGVLDKLGEERSDDPNMDKHYITKNYQELKDVEGGEKSE